MKNYFLLHLSFHLLHQYLLIVLCYLQRVLHSQKMLLAMLHISIICILLSKVLYCICFSHFCQFFQNFLIYWYEVLKKLLGFLHSKLVFILKYLSHASHLRYSYNLKGKGSTYRDDSFFCSKSTRRKKSDFFGRFCVSF